VYSVSPSDPEFRHDLFVEDVYQRLTDLEAKMQSVIEQSISLYNLIVTHLPDDPDPDDTLELEGGRRH
jgi:hypothetical protein